jgi:hypothetical protein
MPDANVHAVGQVQDIDGADLIVGVDYTTVVLREPGQLGRQWRFERDATEDLARLIVAASWEAAAGADDYREGAGEYG